MEDLKQILGAKVGTNYPLKHQLDMIEMYQLRICCNRNSMTWPITCSQRIWSYKIHISMMLYTVHTYLVFVHTVVSLYARPKFVSPPKIVDNKLSTSCPEVPGNGTFGAFNA